MDSWNATKEIMLAIEKYGKIYYCPLKENRKVYDSSGSQPYRRVDMLKRAEQDRPKSHCVYSFSLEPPEIGCK
jgi:hypothetical protein